MWYEKVHFGGFANVVAPPTTSGQLMDDASGIFGSKVLKSEGGMYIEWHILPRFFIYLCMIPLQSTQVKRHIHQRRPGLFPK